MLQWQADRSLHDALCVLMTHVKDSKTVPGAGASEIIMSNAVLNGAQKVSREREGVMKDQ